MSIHFDNNIKITHKRLDKFSDIMVFNVYVGRDIKLDFKELENLKNKIKK